MRASRFSAWLVAVLVCSRAGFSDPPENPRASPTGVDQTGVRFVPIWIATPIDETFETRARQMLGLSDAQAEFLGVMLKELAGRDAELRSARLPELREKSIQLGSGGSASNGELAHTELYAEFIRQCEAFTRDLGRTEDAAIHMLEPSLTPEQVAVLPQLRAYRERQRCAVLPMNSFAAAVDLADLVVELDMTAPMRPTDRESFDTMLATYESALTTVVRKWVKTQFESMMKNPSRVASNVHEADARVRSERLKAIEQSQKDRMRLEDRIRRLNDAYIGLLMDALAEDDAQRILFEYRRRAYPEVWPNPFDISDILGMAEARLSVDQRDALRAVSSQFVAQQQQATLEMQRRVERWWEQLSVTGSISQRETKIYQLDLDELQARRQEGAEAALAAMLALWNGNTPTDIVQIVDEYRFAKQKRRPQPMRMSYLP